MALIAQALTTLANLYEHLKVASDEQTGFASEAERLINRVSGLIARYTNRNLLKQATATQVYDGDGRDELLLREWPIAGITSLTVDGDTIPVKSGWDQSGYYTDEGDDYSMLHLDGYAFDVGRQNVTIAASYGYTSGAVELLDLEEAALLWCAYFYNRRTPGVVTENVEGIAVTYGSDRVPPQVAAILTPFRNMRIG